MDREEYVQTLRDILSRDPRKIRDANQRLFTAVVANGGGDHRREADLVLAEVAN